MKIAILGTRGIPARYGGFETFAEKLATGLSENDFDVTVFCERRNAGPDLFGRVRLQYVSAPPLGALQTISFDLRCLWVARKSYDIVYMLGYGAAPFCVIPRIWGTRLWINPDGLGVGTSKMGLCRPRLFSLDGMDHGTRGQLRRSGRGCHRQEFRGAPWQDLRVCGNPIWMRGD